MAANTTGMRPLVLVAGLLALAAACGTAATERATQQPPSGSSGVEPATTQTPPGPPATGDGSAATPSTTTEATHAPSPPGSTTSTSVAADGSRSVSPLWGKTFVGRSLTVSGAPRQLVADTAITVTFEWHNDGGIVTWNAGCNTMGSAVTITADVVDVAHEEVAGTTVGCTDDRHHQDEWLTAFFTADPGWDLEEERLTLTAGQTVVELEPA